MIPSKYWKIALWIILAWIIIFSTTTLLWTFTNEKDGGQKSILSDVLSLENEVAIIEEIEPEIFDYIEVISGCGPSFDASCVNAYSGPATTTPVMKQLRKGIILKVGEAVKNESGTWYKIIFDEWIRYPERVMADLYVHSDNVRFFSHEGSVELKEGDVIEETGKYILVDRGDQLLSAYDGKELFMQFPISSGLLVSPTPRGTFKVFRKTPNRYMQGPLPGISEKYYDLPGVPWIMYFTKQGGAIHGTYWHDNFGQKWSSGCVNIPTDTAKKLYEWAEIGTTVIVRD